MQSVIVGQKLIDGVGVGGEIIGAGIGGAGIH